KPICSSQWRTCSIAPTTWVRLPTASSPSVRRCLCMAACGCGSEPTTPRAEDPRLHLHVRDAVYRPREVVRHVERAVGTHGDVDGTGEHLFVDHESGRKVLLDNRSIRV